MTNKAVFTKKAYLIQKTLPIYQQLTWLAMKFPSDRLELLQRSILQKGFELHLLYIVEDLYMTGNLIEMCNTKKEFIYEQTVRILRWYVNMKGEYMS